MLKNLIMWRNSAVLQAVCKFKNFINTSPHQNFHHVYLAWTKFFTEKSSNIPNSSLSTCRREQLEERLKFYKENFLQKSRWHGRVREIRISNELNSKVVKIRKKMIFPGAMNGLSLNQDRYFQKMQLVNGFNSL